MVIAPFAGRLSDRLGGKWILFVGLSLFSLGMGILIASSHLGVSRWHLLPGLLVAGVGMGMTFAPLQTVAMLNVEPRMAGAASGFINTTRQLGGVLGFAAVGALLQAQLSVKLDAAAVKESAALPGPQRAQFIAKFHDVATGNLDIGNAAGGNKLPPGTPEPIRQLAAKVFGEGFVNAMRVTLWAPIVVLAVGALAVLLVRQQTRKPAPAAEDTEAPVAVGG
jgi:MFS family permease